MTLTVKPAGPQLRTVHIAATELNSTIAVRSSEHVLETVFLPCVGRRLYKFIASYSKSYCSLCSSLLPGEMRFQFLVTFRVRRSRGEMYIGHGHLCVCLSVCLSVCASPHSHTTARTRM